MKALRHCRRRARVRESPGTSEGCLRETVREFVVHYNTEPNDQGTGKVIPMRPSGVGESRETPLIRRKRLGGLLSYYQREAA